MTDARAQPSPHMTQASAARRARRHAFGRRINAIGAAIVCLPVLLGLVVLGTLIARSLPALIAPYLPLDVVLKSTDIDPDNSKSQRAIAAANYDAIIDGALQALFPSLTSDVDLGAVRSLVSPGAAAILRDRVMRHPEWIGSAEVVALPFTDRAALYLDGAVTSLEVRATRGRLGVSGRRGIIFLSSTVNNFQPILAAIKAELRQQAVDVRARAAAAEPALVLLEAERAEFNRRRPAAIDDERDAIDEHLKAVDAAIGTRRDELRRMTDQAAILEERAAAPDEPERLDDSQPSYLVRINGGYVKLTSVQSARAEGEVLVPLRSDVVAEPGEWTLIKVVVPQQARAFLDRQIALLENLKARRLVEYRPAPELLLFGDAQNAELAGTRDALIGSLFALGIALAAALPLGLLAAMHLEVLTRRPGRAGLLQGAFDLVAATPSILWGVLGLLLLARWLGLPPATPLVAGIVLAVIMLPLLVAEARAALAQAAESSLEPALALGATRQQVLFGHILPAAVPGLVAGTLRALARALGSAAPLLVLGMALVPAGAPHAALDRATTLAAELYEWSTRFNTGFVDKTAAGLLLLLLLVGLIHAVAVLTGRRSEPKVAARWR